VSGQGRIRILLADQHSLFREAIKTVVDKEWDLEVVAEARDVSQAASEAARVRPDIAHKGETLIPRHMLGTLLSSLLGKRRERDDAHVRMARLTRREKEVLALLAQGADNEMIASTLFISPQTARTHVQNLMSKLGVHSRLEAAAFVTQSGILQDLVLEG
jgi:DNA-binding NarL/FixJ family response regulator